MTSLEEARWRALTHMRGMASFNAAYSAPIDPIDPIEQLKRWYVTGRIDLDRFEEAVELLLRVEAGRE